MLARARYPLGSNGILEPSVSQDYVDEAVIEVHSGRGGDGAATFRREKHVPRGGPDGGDGGRGGDIVLVASSAKSTLLDFHYQKRFRAGNGQPGRSSERTGKDGSSIELNVPIGTVVRDADSGDLLADLVEDGQRQIVCKGGRGGKGNVRFTSSVRQAPTFAEKGEPGEGKKLRLELKLLADIGLVGLPNAGKSTLIRAVSAARPKTGAYPFTTTRPHLGIVRVDDDSFVMADLPGLIEGASEGRGLGHSFLKHVERTSGILHVVECAPVDGSDPLENLRLIRRELTTFSPDLDRKPAMAALSKVDLIGDGEAEAIRQSLEVEGLEVFPISAATNRGLEPLLYRLLQLVREARSKEGSQRVPIVVPKPVVTDVPEWTVVAEGPVFRVVGDQIVRMAAMTNLDNPEALLYLHKRLKRLGILDTLKSQGATEGCTVVIGDIEFTFTEER